MKAHVIKLAGFEDRRLAAAFQHIYDFRRVLESFGHQFEFGNAGRPFDKQTVCATFKIQMPPLQRLFQALSGDGISARDDKGILIAPSRYSGLDLARCAAPRAVIASPNGPGPAAWLKAKVSEKPAAGRNTIVVTHMPNITAAFPDQANGLQDGETLAFKPDGHGHAELVAKIPIEDWIGSKDAR